MDALLAPLGLIYAIYAAIAWDAQADLLRECRQRRWSAITIGYLVPIYNTIVAWCYVRDGFKLRG